MEPLLLRINEAAKATGLCPATVRNMITAGEFPGVVRIRRCVRINREILEQWVKKQTSSQNEN